MSKEKNYKNEESKESLLVVKELPTEEVTTIEGRDGKVYKLITEQQALQEILIKIREIHGAL